MLVNETADTYITATQKKQIKHSSTALAHKSPYLNKANGYSLFRFAVMPRNFVDRLRYILQNQIQVHLILLKRAHYINPSGSVYNDGCGDPNSVLSLKFLAVFCAKVAFNGDNGGNCERTVAFISIFLSGALKRV